jgi:hypothetical protein
MADNLKLATKNLTKFTGTDDFEDWYRVFLATADAWGLEDAVRYKALLLVLDQSILTRVMAETKEAGTLPKEAKDRTLEWLVAELRKRYAYDKTVLRRLHEFLDRKKKPEETLEGYIVTKRQLYLNFIDLFRADKQSWTDGARVFWEASIDGLPNHIQPAVKTLHPVDAAERKFDELIKTLRSLQGSEPKLAAPGASSTPSPPGTEIPQVNKPPQEKQLGSCPRCGLLGHHRWNCPQRPQRPAQGTQEKSSSQPSEGQEGRKEVSIISSAAPLDNRCYVSVDVQHSGNPLGVGALVDSGADVSVIQYDTACLLHPEEHWASSKISQIFAANGRPLPVVGELKNVKLKLGNDTITTNLVITPDIKASLVLGRDVLMKTHSIVDVFEGVLRLPNSIIPMVDQREFLNSRQQSVASLGHTQTVSRAKVASTANGERRRSDALSF